MPAMIATVHPSLYLQWNGPTPTFFRHEYRDGSPGVPVPFRLTNLLQRMEGVRLSVASGEYPQAFAEPLLRKFEALDSETSVREGTATMTLIEPLNTDLMRPVRWREMNATAVAFRVGMKELAQDGTEDPQATSEAYRIPLSGGELAAEFVVAFDLSLESLEEVQ